MNKKDKNNQSINKVFKYQWGNLISMPMIAPSNTNAGEKQREVLSYIPITDVAVDIEKAALNPTKTNVVNAGTTIALNALGAKYLKYLTKGSKEIKQMAKVAKDKYDELIKLLNKNRNSVVRSRSTREEATRLGNQAQSVLSDYYAYNRAANIQKVPEYFMYSIWPFADAGINYAQNSLESKKQGGMLELLKKGSRIHIKEKNKGTFTRWCGGNVTDECIQRGKNSSNPKIRKKATFAANARKWKHKEGGIIKAQGGSKFNWQSIANIGGTLLNTYLQNKKVDSQAKAAQAEEKVDLSKTFFDLYQEGLKKAAQQEQQQIKAAEAMTGTVTNASPISIQNNAYRYASAGYGQKKSEQNQKNAQIKAQADAEKFDNTTSAISGLIQNGLGMIGDYYNNKSSSSSYNSPSYFSNYVNSQFKNYGTFNSDGSMNLGNGLGTISIKDGYKPRQYSMFDYTKIG